MICTDFGSNMIRRATLGAIYSRVCHDKRSIEVPLTCTITLITMRKDVLKTFKPWVILTFVLLAAISCVSCSNSKQKASGDLKRTQYCERYREFDEKVSTAEPKEQKELLENIVKSKDFPNEPASLAADYKTFIDGLNKYLNGEDTKKDESKYKAASERISRHAIDHCELLKSNSGSNI